MVRMNASESEVHPSTVAFTSEYWSSKSPPPVPHTIKSGIMVSPGRVSHVAPKRLNVNTVPEVAVDVYTADLLS